MASIPPIEITVFVAVTLDGKHLGIYGNREDAEKRAGDFGPGSMVLEEQVTAQVTPEKPGD